MSERDQGSTKSIKIKRPKRRVRTPLKTGTVVHKSEKTYSRKKKHKQDRRESDEDGSDSAAGLDRRSNFSGPRRPGQSRETGSSRRGPRSACFCWES
jgi:hypothetical protein